MPPDALHWLCITNTFIHRRIWLWCRWSEFQKAKDEMKPISFVSKSLNFSQLNWSTVQKEAYAIFLCCTKLDPLLRDRKFTIHTDHKNLTYMKSSPSSMVGRCSMALQELDYTIAYVQGSKNTVANAISRICANVSDLVIKVQPETTGTEPDKLPGPFCGALKVI